MTVDLAVVVPVLVQVLVNLALLVGLLVAGGRWLRGWLRRQVAEPLGKVHAEMTPNAGHSIKDTVTDTQQAVASLTRRFEDHLILGHGHGPVDRDVH